MSEGWGGYWKLKVLVSWQVVEGLAMENDPEPAWVRERMKGYDEFPKPVLVVIICLAIAGLIVGYFFWGQVCTYLLQMFE